MNITSKSRYALKIMMDLAEHSLDRPDSMPGQPTKLTQRADIARRQGIPLDYMDQILMRLRDSELIASTRGRAGGYRLARAAERISTHEIFSSVEDAYEPVQCLEGEHNCALEHNCSSRNAWGRISSAIRQSLSGILLADLVLKKVPVDGESRFWQEAIPETLHLQECRAPSRTMGRVGGTRQ